MVSMNCVTITLVSLESEEKLPFMGMYSLMTYEVYNRKPVFRLLQFNGPSYVVFAMDRQWVVGSGELGRAPFVMSAASNAATPYEVPERIWQVSKDGGLSYRPAPSLKFECQLVSQGRLAPRKSVPPSNAPTKQPTLPVPLAPTVAPRSSPLDEKLEALASESPHDEKLEALAAPVPESSAPASAPVSAARAAAASVKEKLYDRMKNIMSAAAVRLQLSRSGALPPTMPHTLSPTSVPTVHDHHTCSVEAMANTEVGLISEREDPASAYTGMYDLVGQDGQEFPAYKQRHSGSNPAHFLFHLPGRWGIGMSVKSSMFLLDVNSNAPSPNGVTGAWSMYEGGSFHRYNGKLSVVCTFTVAPTTVPTAEPTTDPTKRPTAPPRQFYPIIRAQSQSKSQPLDTRRKAVSHNAATTTAVTPAEDHITTCSVLLAFVFGIGIFGATRHSKRRSAAESEMTPLTQAVSTDVAAAETDDLGDV